jgi:hypothetical protein
MDLSAGIFDDLIGDAAQAITWASSDLCPCRSLVSGMALPGCPNCGGKGVIWGQPVACWTGLASMSVAKQWAAFSQWEAGSVVFSIPEDSPFYACGEQDRVVLIQSSEPFRSVLNHTGAEKVNYVVEVVDRVFWLDPTTKQIVDGSIPMVDSTGLVDFAGLPLVPPAGIQYTMRGRKRPEFYIFQELPQDRAHFYGARLPRRVGAKRFDLFGR